MSLLPEMSDIVARHAPPDLSRSAVPRLRLYGSNAQTRLVPVAYDPMLCLVVCGAKQTILGETVYSYHAGDCLVVSAELPVCGSIVEAPSVSYTHLTLPTICSV